MKNRYRLLGMVLAAIILQSCADKRPAEEIVRERSEQRLALLMDGDVEKAFKYTTPLYQTRVDIAQYHASFAGVVDYWTGVTINSVRCELEICHVEMKVEYTMRHGHGEVSSKRLMKEKWLKIDRKWYIYHSG